MRNFLNFPVLLFLTLGLIGLAQAAPSLEDQITALTKRSFKVKMTAVQNLAATGDARVVPILEALLVGRLYTRRSDNKVVIAEKKVGFISFMNHSL